MASSMKSIAALLLALLTVQLGLGAGTRRDVGIGAAAPNIILILSDDQGWSQLSHPMDPRVAEAHSTYLETPNLTRLAREGMRLTSGYSPAPLCTPSRRSILCGTTAARSGGEFSSPWVPAEHATIPTALRQANPAYRCAHFGKWGEQMNSTPEECGYDASDGVTGNVTGGMPLSLGAASKNHNLAPPHFIDNEDPKRTFTVTDRAVQFIREQVRAERPFYLQVSYYAVHLSVVCREDTLRKYQQKGTPDRGYTQAWAAMLEEMDAGVGRLLDVLDQTGAAEKTYVFFTSDNGGRGTVPGGSGAPPNLPLTGAKHSLDEGGIRVPFLARGPGIRPGSVCNRPVAGYDFLSTFYDLAGGSAPLPGEIDGVSFKPLLSNPDAPLRRPDDALFFHRPQRQASAIRSGDYKLKLVWNRNGAIASRHLYRVDPDPREQGRDISADDPQRADRLQAMLLAHVKSVEATPTPATRKK